MTRLIQTDNDNCVIEGTLDGLKPGKHQLKIHEFGDLSKGCNRLVLAKFKGVCVCICRCLNKLSLVSYYEF